jgi:hypothetical protein
MSLPSRSLAPASGSTTSLSDSSARRRFAKLSRRASTAPRASTETQNETSTSGRLIVYTKPGCCLCDGLSAKLETVLERSRAGETSARTGATWDSLKDFTLEHRDVSTRDSWAQEYAGSVPRVFFIDGASEEVEFPRPAPKTPPERVGDDLDAMVRRHRGGAPPTRPKTSSSSSWSVNTNAPDSGGVTF